MGKIVKWIEAVIANNHIYAPMAGVDIIKSTDNLFEKETNEIKMSDEDRVSDVKASSNFSISWLGSASSSNSASVQTTYSGGNLGVSVVVTGTPVAGVACVVTVTPTNCELKSGDSKVTITIDSANLGTTFLSDITPSSSYKGITVKYTVSIKGGTGDILYAKGNIG